MLLHYQLINAKSDMKKYYLDKEGVIRILQKMSSEIRNNTNNKINVSEEIDSQTGETIKRIQNPNKLVTTKAVVDYIQSGAASVKEKLTINQQSTAEEETGYNVEDNITEYNGSEAVQINIKLADYADIQNLFI